VTAVLLVAAGAAVGAPVRFLVDRWAREHSTAGTALGTLVLNVAGSAVIGVVAGLRDPAAWVVPLVAVGFCGALTTFSTLAFELWVVLARGEWRPFVANLALSLALGGAAVWLGFALGRAL
jgi:fluoride exporter